MRYDEYAERLRSYRAPGVWLARYGMVHENGRRLPLLSLHTRGRARLVLTAGFHGEEPSGPLTLVHRLPEVLELARSHDVGLDVFPCINPSGFEGGHRYNASGEQPNNDFLRYEVAPGEWKDQLEAGASFLRWQRFDAGPKETRALRSALAALPLPDAALDLHQDAYTEGDLTYAYVFGDDAPYLPMVEAAGRWMPIGADTEVDGPLRTNVHGLVRDHDGSVTDWYQRRGVPFTATLETTTHTPQEVTEEVNLAWIRGFIGLAARAAISH